MTNSQAFSINGVLWLIVANTGPAGILEAGAIAVAAVSFVVAALQSTKERAK